MIEFYNRKDKKYEVEKVAGDAALKILYSNPIGKSSLELIIKRKLISSIYGKYCDSIFSRKKIDNFIRDFDIDMSISNKSSSDFNSFNEFFVRELNHEARPIDYKSDRFISCGDGRLTVYENIDIDNLVQIKGFTYSLKDLIKNDNLSFRYNCGTCLILRLNPTDYHRFHFVDNGYCEKSTKINGSYYSVNPIALNTIPKLFCENKREYSIFHSENFGNIIYVEVGATCVGSIIQSYQENSPVKKGDEKGYFKFGGSTVIMFIEKNRIKIDDDIVNESLKGIETKILMGETIGRKL